MIKKPYTWLEISKSAFEHNLKTLSGVIGANVALGIIVKGNAYGHGITQIGKLCQESAYVNWLCVVSLSEALVLRTHGISKPILVLSTIDENPALAITNNIELIAYNLETINLLNEEGKVLGKPAHIHLKVDTGMSRFGFALEKAPEIIRYALGLPFIKITGLCTHFSESENSDASFTNQQLTRFNNLIEELKKDGITFPFVHMANSAAAALHPDARFNLVRIGAAAYGFKSSNNPLELKPILTWKTRIMHIQPVPTNTPIGYARTYITNRPTTIAALPIGYYEGYDRRLSNKGIMYVDGSKATGEAPVLGRICMNVTMIDITNLSGAQVGDEVILLGGLGTSAHTMAEQIESFNPHEITTRLNPLLTRIVVD